MPEYYNVTTNLGDAELANAIATNTKLNITHIAFGDGNGSVPTPTKTRTSLVREVHRQAVTKYERHATNANWIVIETIIPSGVGGFTIREMGIIANGKLISHGSHAPFEKVADPSGVSEYRLRFVQDITDASVVSIILDQSLIYASQAWVKENYIKRTEIVDNLITADPNKPLSANAGKSLQDGKLGKNDNAVSATKLQTARTIGGVSFDGTTNINLPGVNAAGTQSTTGNAATATTAAACSGNAASATKLQTARTIGGVSFDGSANINLPGVNAAGTQSTTGNAATATTAAACSGNAASATKLQTARTIGGVSFDGSANINLPGVNADGTQSTTGNAATATTAAACSGNAASATKLQTARTIGGVSFDGSANINLPGVNADGTQSTTGNAATATTAAACSGNAASATKLQTARTIAISGAVTGTATGFDGSANIAIATTAIDGSKISSGTVPVARLPAASTIAAGAVKLNNTLTSTSATEALTAAQGNVLQSIFNSFVMSSTTDGYIKIPVGNETFILQWGSGTIINGGSSPAFKIAFPNACLKAFACEGVASYWLPSWFTLYGVAGATKTNLDVRGVVYNNSRFSSGDQIVFNYFAIGY